VVLITDGERLRRVKAAVMRFRTRALCSSWPSTVQSARWARDMATWLHLQWRLPPPAIVFPGTWWAAARHRHCRSMLAWRSWPSGEPAHRADCGMS